VFLGVATTRAKQTASVQNKTLFIATFQAPRVRCNGQENTSSVNEAEGELVLYIPCSKVFSKEVTRL